MRSIFKGLKDTRIPKRITNSCASNSLEKAPTPPLIQIDDVSEPSPGNPFLEDSDVTEETVPAPDAEEIVSNIPEVPVEIPDIEILINDSETENKIDLNMSSPEHKNTNLLPVTTTPPAILTTTPATSPTPQRLLFKLGLNEDEDEVVDATSGAESPLIFKQSHYTQYNIVAPATPGLNRISTWNSSLAHISVRHDSRSRYRPGAVRKNRRRAILKNGDCNILQSRISKHRLRFLQDIFTTLVDTQWRWTLIVFALSFLLSWLGFAVIWWLISFTHGDFDAAHLPDFQIENNWKPCVSNIFDFTSCFLFSIETQHTIGYGFRTTSEECPEAIFVMCMQSICGVMIQAFMVGIVFAKMTRPKHRTQTLLFSRNAVICQRDGYLCLMFRVGDMRKSHIIGASIRAQLIRPKTTKEGEVLTNYQTELNVNADGCDGDLFFIWPMTVVHQIDENSPLYHLSAADMLQDRFEIVVILEGTIESTGQTTQARSSYVAAEVLWGHRFEPVVSYNKDRQGYEVKYSKFDNTLQVDTPLCSGAELAEFYRMQEPVGFDARIYLLDENFYRENSTYVDQRSNREMEDEVDQIKVIIQENYLPPEPEDEGVKIEEVSGELDYSKDSITVGQSNNEETLNHGVLSYGEGCSKDRGSSDNMSDDVFLDDSD